MAEFEKAFNKTMMNEGGYVLHEVKGDRGGMTFAGIARNFWPKWEGWLLIDAGDMDNPVLTQAVRGFYKANFWDKIKGDDLKSQIVAEQIYDFGVNTGTKRAIRIAQRSIGLVPDGIIGPKTLEAFNAISSAEFVLAFALAKMARYAEICNRNRGQSKFLLGWLNRTLKMTQGV